MKKNLLTTGCMALLVAGSMAQTFKLQQPSLEEQSQYQYGVNATRCATKSPDKAWDDEFNRQVEEFTQNLANGKATATNYTIAVIVHVIHNNEVLGGATSYNLSQAQIKSQITVLNNDYRGVGYNSNTYPCAAFANYASATTNSVSAASKDAKGRVAIANTGITFCLALQDSLGNTLAEPGIDRIDRNTKGWTTPPYSQSYIDGTIKPATIWNPKKYFNIWVCNLGGGLLGYATFPASSGNIGLTAPYGTGTTDGVVILGSAFGNTGYQSISQYNKGRSCTHETGHWLGLRHIWGDGGQCGASDYCKDTPPAKGQTNSPPGAYYGCPSYPSQAGTCTMGGQTNTDGDMFMNFMDYTDDACMYMFTNDQKIRMQTTMTNGTFRAPLTGNSVALCSATPVTPVANIMYSSCITACENAQFLDASSGPATGWAWSVNPSTGVVITSASSQDPTISFPAGGTYTVSLTASNSAGNNSVSKVVTVTSCTTTSTASCDTLSNLASTDTLTYYTVTNGYLSGSSTLSTTTTTTYQNKAIGELCKQANFPTGVNTVKGAMILFYKDATLGTKGTSNITLSMVNNNAGVPGTTVMATQTLSLSSVVGTTPVSTVPYAGSQAVTIGPYMLPYAVMFPSPVSFSSDFFLTLTTPTNSDTIVVYSGIGNHNAANTAAIQLKSSASGTSTWYAVNNVFGQNFSFGIIPIACPANGIESNELSSSVSIFPNPSEGNFNFAVSMPSTRTLTFNVVNTLGQTVFEKTERNLNNSVLTYDFSSFKKGIYFVQITDSENNKTVKKIVIE